MPLVTLNPQQQKAARHGMDKEKNLPLLILAGAGTGKTATLAARLVNLVSSGVSPNRVMLLTFSRRAASELTERCKCQLQERHVVQGHFRLPWAGTFHSIGHRIVREHAPLLGLEKDFSVMDRSDAADLMDSVRTDLACSRVDRRFPRKDTLLAIYSQCVNRQENLETVLQERFPWCSEWQTELRKIFRGYVQAKGKYHTLDYDDLLLYWHRLVQEPHIAKSLDARFDHLLIDEYQDTNQLQANIVKLIKPDGAGVTAVGDDGQAIYGFRGATIDHILSFPNSFRVPGTVIRLETNYRCTQPILDAANALLAESQRAYPKTLRAHRLMEAQKPRLVTVLDEPSQAVFLCEEVLRNREQGVPLKHQAILFRAAHHSDILEVELKRRNIPYVKHGGLKFLEAAHVKDFLAVIKWGHNPEDRMSALRVLQLLPNIGPSSAAREFDRLLQHNSSFSAMLAAASTSGKTELQSLWALLERIRHQPEDGWLVSLGLVLEWLEPIHQRLHDNADVRHNDLICLTSLASHHTSVQDFVVSLVLDPPTATGDLAGSPLLDEDYLVLSTIHSAKGQEWDEVFVIQVADGNFPSEYATGHANLLEEERRLLYVAMTRAKRGLTLTRPLRYYVPEQPRHGDKHVYGAHSRFLTERVQACFQVTTWPPAEQHRRPDASAAAANPLIDIRKELSDMW